MSLLPWSQIMRCMPEDEGERNADRDRAENGANEETETMEGDLAEEWLFVNVAILKCSVAVGPRRRVR